MRKYIEPKSKSIGNLNSVPTTAIFKVIDTKHVNKALHPGHDKTYHMIKENYWFPNMAEIIKDRIQS